MLVAELIHESGDHEVDEILDTLGSCRSPCHGTIGGDVRVAMLSMSIGLNGDRDGDQASDAP